jgi:hypothetical protein
MTNLEMVLEAIANGHATPIDDGGIQYIKDKHGVDVKAQTFSVLKSKEKNKGKTSPPVKTTSNPLPVKASEDKVEVDTIFKKITSTSVCLKEIIDAHGIAPIEAIVNLVEKCGAKEVFTAFKFAEVYLRKVEG